ncbi:MAG: purine-nucleoside phosphorylase [Anaeroplasmataceae bacterium]
MIPTAHINCNDASLIAKTVLMPGDPLRAKFLADNYLTDVIQFNATRNIYGFTGLYKGKKISVMASGMGMASMGIYSYELYKFFNVDTIIRIGSCGSYNKNIDLYDVCLVNDSYSESTYAKVQSGYDSCYIEADQSLNSKLIEIADLKKIDLKTIRCHSSDVFYSNFPNKWLETSTNYKCDVVEMESFALFANAKILNKKAACLLTCSDSFITQKVTTAEEREKSFTKMMEIALEIA